MSPPQVNMQAKPVPYLISQEAESREVSKLGSRKFRIVAITVVLCMVILGATVFGAIAYSYRLFYKQEYKAESIVDGEKMSENIFVDYRKEMIYVNNKQTGRIDGVKALYNYNMKLVALYDETQNICLIDKLNQTFDEGLKFWSEYKGIDLSASNRNFTYDNEPIKSEVLRRFGGEEVAYHCGNAIAYWILGSTPITGEIKDYKTEKQVPASKDKHNIVKRQAYPDVCRHDIVVYNGVTYLHHICELPDVECPNCTYCSTVECPKSECPRVDCPKCPYCPKVECPKVDCPEVDCPKCPYCPKVECPKVDCPRCPYCPKEHRGKSEYKCPGCVGPNCPICGKVEPAGSQDIQQVGSIISLGEKCPSVETRRSKAEAEEGSRVKRLEMASRHFDQLQM